MKNKIIYRNAITGEIVTAKYAKENPDTTTKETMKRVPRKAVKKLKEHRDWLDLPEDEAKEMEPIYPKGVIDAIDEILKYFAK